MTLWCSCLSPHCTLRLPQLHIVYLLILAPCGRVGLMMYIMYINRDLEVWPDYGSVIDEFAVKDRRLSFIWHWWHWWFWLSICHGKGSDKRRGCSFCCLHRFCFCHRSYNKHPHLAKCLMTRSACGLSATAELFASLQYPFCAEFLQISQFCTEYYKSLFNNCITKHRKWTRKAE